jgi:hypothetical protein
MKKIIILLLACFITIGCGRGNVIEGLVPCGGTVTLDGEPLEGAAVAFIPVDSTGKIEIGKRGGTAISNSSGQFSIKTTSDSSGIAPGTYKATVVKMVDEKPDDVNKSSIPKSITGKYADMKTSDLTVEISNSGNKSIKLEMKLK